MKLTFIEFGHAIFRQCAFQIILGLLLFVRAASAQSCIVDAPRYNLIEDTVDWSMKIASGRSCILGVRFANVEIESVKLDSPPQSGQIALQGPGFKYSAKADFVGEDSFALAVIGAVNKTHGSSIIHFRVSVIDPLGKLTTRDDIPPSVSITEPSSGATVSGSFVTLAATAADNVAVASVQFVIDGKHIGLAVTSPPYSITWNSAETADGVHTIYAVAQDTSGNYGTSSTSVTVKNRSTK